MGNRIAFAPLLMAMTLTTLEFRPTSAGPSESRPASAPVQAAVAADAASIERNSGAFLFVVEFALGAPLTHGQESVILEELRRSWEARSEQELSKFDAYPRLVAAIVRATNGQALDELRAKLEQEIRQMLAAADGSDRVVAAITAQINAKGKVLIQGNPPLTAMAAEAYGEMYAYSELLQMSPDAEPAQVAAEHLAKTRDLLLKSWPGFSPEQRQQVSETPGLWISLRSLLRYGTDSDRTDVLSEIKQVAASGQEAGGLAGGAVGGLVKQQVLLNVKNQTFDQHLFCRGFGSSVF